MGHDITAHEVPTDIAYLRYGAGNRDARRIYELLGVPTQDCGCSGCGDWIYFAREQIEMALSKIPTVIDESDDSYGFESNWDEEMEFLEEILQHSGKQFLIHFG